jgi:hypothetical protein
MLQVSLLREREDLVARCVPYVLVEDLDLYRAGVPCGVDGLPDAPDLNRTVSHHGAAQEEVGLRGEPVVRVEAEDAPQSARDQESRVPSALGSRISTGNTVAGPLPHPQAHSDLSVPTHRRPVEQQPHADERDARNHGTEQRHTARVGHLMFGDRVGDNTVFGVHVANILLGVINAGITVDVAGISTAICAVTHNTTSISTNTRRAYDREGVVGSPGKHIVLRIHRYRYDELVWVVSQCLREGLPKLTPAVGHYGSVRLQGDVRVIRVPDTKRNATIAHGYGQLIALRRKLTVFGLYDDLVYPVDPGAIREYVYDISRNEHILADSRPSRQGPFISILRLGIRR